MDWKMCVLCQKVDSLEKLVFPNKKSYDAASDGYVTLANNLAKFFELGQLPQCIDLNKFNDGSGIEKTLRKNDAKWHKNCFSKYNNSHLQRAQKRASTQEILDKISSIKTRRVTESFKKESCIFCDSDPSADGRELSKVSTFNTSCRISETAAALRDSNILSKISGHSDLMALEAMYHPACCADFYNRLRKQKSAMNKENGQRVEERTAEGLALIGVKQYIENERASAPSESIPVFKMSKLAEIYKDSLKNLGVQCERVHTTRLKNRLVDACPYLRATTSSGKDTLISFDKDIDFVMRSELKRNYDSEALCLANAADVIRKDIFQHPSLESDIGNLQDQRSCLPPSLLWLVQMVVRGSTNSITANDELTSEENDGISDQAVNSIAQLIFFHTTKLVKGPSSRHNRHKETPVPKFLALKLFASTRSKSLIDTTYRLGLSISYDRLQCILSELSNKTCEQYHKENLVCPPSLSKGVFTTASADNIDHNPSSNTAKTAFHGTAIAMMQHVSPTDNEIRRDTTDLSCNEGSSTGRKVRPLPLAYSYVQPVTINTSSAKCPVSPKWEPLLPTSNKSFEPEIDWLKQCTSSQGLPWAVYHARKSPCPSHQTRGALLPVFTEQAHDAATMCHVMGIAMKGIRHLNPHQTPVLVLDQPLYALCKQIQYINPGEFGENKIFILLGGLHIEMDCLRIVGQWLEESGWVETLVRASVISKGRAESILKVGHVLRSRYAHEVTASVLFDLQQKAYNIYSDTNDEDEVLPFDEWCQKKCNEIPQFKYWDTTFRLQLMMLQLVRAIRTANFSLYKESLSQIVPWCFALNHVHYARWLTVHIRDLDTLKEQHPALHKEFERGKFVAAKTGRPFSHIALDHAHEQFNAVLKGAGGMIGLTENPSALKKWMLSAPEIATVVSKFEEEVLHMKENIEQYTSHHRDSPAQNEQFRRHVLALEEVFEDLGNPFLEESTDVYNLETRKVKKGMVDTLMTIESKGVELYKEFVRGRLVSGSVELMATIKREKNMIFSTHSPAPSRVKSKLAGLKNDCALFIRLYIACQNRRGDLEEFFTRENQPFPPSLTDDGEVGCTGKSKLIKCLLNSSDKSESTTSPIVQAKLYDGGFLLHLLHPRNSITFNNYAEEVVLPYLKKESLNANRIDVVWDRYFPGSLKTSTREERGTGIRVKVTSTGKVPKGWPNFLRNSDNKDELSKLLASYIINSNLGNTEVYSTHGSDVLTTSTRNYLGALKPCEHEEADTRLMLHIADIVAQGLCNIMIRSKDTDVVVLAVYCCEKLKDIQTLWISFGTGCNHTYLAAHEIAAAIGPEKSLALPFFHAFTGCDTTSSFAGKAKKSAFAAWKSKPEVTEAFLSAASGNVGTAKEGLERYVVYLYDKSAGDVGINMCRMRMYTKSTKKLPQNIPPTSDALYQHSLRAAHQAQIWNCALNPTLPSLDPSEWGWEKGANGEWVPTWTTIPDASESIELIKCGCKNDCLTRCKCVKSELPCTQLCGCDAMCSRNDELYEF